MFKPVHVVTPTHLQGALASSFPSHFPSRAFFSQAFLVFLMKESNKKRQKHPGKLMDKSCSQLVNLPRARPLMNPLHGMHTATHRLAIISNWGSVHSFELQIIFTAVASHNERFTAPTTALRYMYMYVFHELVYTDHIAIVDNAY